MKALAPWVFIFSLLILAAQACQKDDPGIEESLAGIWTLSEKTVDSEPVTLPECELQGTIEFRADNICLLYDACTGKTTNSGWDYKYGMLNISEHLPAAWYIDELDEGSLKIRRKDISQTGLLETTVLVYIKKPGG